MSSTAAAIDRVAADLRQVLSDDTIAGVSDAERMAVLRAAGDVLRLAEAVIVETTATAGPDFSHAYGCRGQNELLRRALLVDAAQATRFGKAVDAVTREVNLVSGERLPARFPKLREALLDGALGVTGLLAATGPLEQARHRIGAIDRQLADADLAAYARGCEIVGEDVTPPVAACAAATDDGVDGVDGDAVEPAPAATPEDLRLAAFEWAMRLDPDGAEPADRSAQQKRSFTIGPLRDGCHRAQGSLLPDVAAQLQLIFDAQCNPKTDGPAAPGVAFRPGDAFSSDGMLDDEDAFNSDPRGVIDPRSAAQRRHDALAAALSIAAGHRDMPSLGGAAPTLVVHVDAADYAAGTGWATVAGSQAPVPMSIASHTACRGTVQRVLFDEGRIVGIGVTDRIFTAHQRRAIVLRDRECLIPGCHVPASWCEIHHVSEHARGGPTHTDNGVPLCWWHHRSLDRSGWEIRMDRGVPQIRGPAWWDPHRRWRTPRHSLPAIAEADTRIPVPG